MSPTPKKYQQPNNVCTSTESSKDISTKSEPLNNNLDADIKIELVEQKDADDVLRLLKEFFFKVRMRCNKN